MDQDVVAQSSSRRERIVALDIIRGYFLLVILINHIEIYPSGFDLLTGRGRLMVSAAEGFFFMSGLLVGMVYKRRLAQGMRFIFKKMWSRALELYVGSVLLTIIFTAAAVWLKHPNIKQGLWYPITNWWQVIRDSLLMTYNFGWADFLDRFALMMLVAPLGFFLLVKNKWWLLAIASIAIWAAPGNNNPWDTLNFQIIFMGGMILGYHWYELRRWWRHLGSRRRRLIKRGVVWLAGITFLLSYASVFLLSLLNEKINGLPNWLASATLHWNTFNSWIWQYAQKWTMGPLRIFLFFLWFWALFMVVQKYAKSINRRTAHVIEIVGKNSLFVYIAHAFIVFIFKLFIPANTNLIDNFIITAAALAVLIGITLVYKKFEPPIALSFKHRERPAPNQ